MIVPYVTDYKTSQVAGISIIGAWDVGHLQEHESEIVNDEGDGL
jgi:hypothetical protein